MKLARVRRLLIAAFAAALSAPLAAQSPSQLADINLEDLLGVSVQRVFGAAERLQPVTEAASSVTIVTADEIDRYGYRTLADILRGVRGFFVSNDRNYSYVGVRGFGRPGDYNSRVLLLINGHKFNDNVYDQAYIGAELGIDVAMFDRVEIIRGPASSLYGTSAFFAVVNVITKSGAAMDGVRLEADAGTLGSQLGRASYGRRLANGIDVAASGTYESSQGMGRLYFPAFDAVDTNRGVAENLDGEQIAEVYGRVNMRDLTVTATFGRRLKFVPTASFGSLFNSQAPREQTTDQHAMVDARYDHVVGRTHIAANLSFDRAAYDGIYPFAGDAGEVLTDRDGSVGARWTVGGRVTRALPGRQTVTGGGEFLANVTQRQFSLYDNAVTPGFDIDQSSNQSAVFVQDEFRMRPWLIVNAGLRYDHYDNFSRTTPRGAVIVTPSASYSFKYLYGRAFRAPNAYELFYYGDASGRLRPESIDTHELVWEQYVGEWLRTSVSAYHYTASQLITFNLLGPVSEQDYGFFNGGIVRARGVEFEAEVRSKRGFQLVGSYARQRAEDDNLSTLTNSPEQMAKVRLGTPGPLARSILGVELQYLSARRTPAGTTVSGVVLANATLTAPVTRSWQFVATMRNLFNQPFSDPASDEHLPDAIPQNGRTARIGLRWSRGSR